MAVVVERKGIRYVEIGRRPYTRENGEPSEISEWRLQCTFPGCKNTFTITTPAGFPEKWNNNRRNCPTHRGGRAPNGERSPAKLAAEQRRVEGVKAAAKLRRELGIKVKRTPPPKGKPRTPAQEAATQKWLAAVREANAKRQRLGIRTPAQEAATAKWRRAIKEGETEKKLCRQAAQQISKVLRALQAIRERLT